MKENRYNVRNAELNLQTKKNIADSLILFMKKRAFYKITVTDICKQAGVSRNAFYRNFIDLNDILKYYLREKWHSYFSESLKKYGNEIRTKRQEIFLRYLYSEKELLFMLREQNLLHTLEAISIEEVGLELETKGFLYYQQWVIAYGIYGFVLAIINRNFEDRVEDVISYLETESHLHNLQYPPL